MGVGSRKMEYRKKLFVKSFRLPMKRVAKAMPVGFSDKEFFDAYKKYYPYMMEEAQKMCDDYKRHNALRKKKGYKNMVFFPEPDDLLKKVSAGVINATRKAHNCGEIATSEEQAKYTLALEQDSNSNIENRKRKEEAFLELAQEVEPQYIKKLVSLYFVVRKANTLDINSRYLILLEIAQFKCKESIDFLGMINACDKNNDIRHLAFDLLQQMGEHPWLARNMKGRKRLSAITPIDIAENPTRLVEHIYKYQEEIHHRYDVFLSHSSYDMKLLLKLKQRLNAEGKVIYIDWVNDKVMMNRRNQNEDTWTALKLRMDESDKMLFVMTDNSLRSEWTRKEIEYFKTQNKEVVVFQPEEITEVPFEALTDCKSCTIETFLKQ